MVAKKKYTKKQIKLEKEKRVCISFCSRLTKKKSVFILEIILVINFNKLFSRNVSHCV